MNGELDVNPAFFQQVAQFAGLVLGLGHRQAVSRHADHRLGIGQQRGGIFRLDRLDVARFAVRRRAAGHRHRAQSPEQDVGQRPVHRHAHDLGQDQPGRPDQRAGDDQAMVLDHEPGHRRRQAGVGVQQGDHHRHVADRDY